MRGPGARLPGTILVLVLFCTVLWLARDKPAPAPPRWSEQPSDTVPDNCAHRAEPEEGWCPIMNQRDI